MESIFTEYGFRSLQILPSMGSRYCVIEITRLMNDNHAFRTGSITLYGRQILHDNDTLSVFTMGELKDGVSECWFTAVSLQVHD